MALASRQMLRMVPRMKVPSWASFFSGEEYRGFRALLEADMKRRGISVAIDHLDHGVMWPGEVGKGPHYGLANIARTCHASDGDWPQLIAHHFDLCFAPGDSTAEPVTFDEIRHVLKVRLYPIRYSQSAKPVFRNVADDIIAVLAFDLPDKVVTVSDAQVERWGEPLDALFEIAYDNVRDEGHEVVLHEGEAPVFTLSSGSYFASTHAMFVEQYTSVSEPGVLIVMPCRDSIAWHVIESQTVLSAITPLLTFAQQSYAQQPAPLSPNLYWKRGEDFVRLPSGMGDNGLWIAPPDEFNDLVQSLVS